MIPRFVDLALIRPRDMLITMKVVSTILAAVIIVIVGMFAAGGCDWRPQREVRSAPVGETRSDSYEAELVRVFDGDSLIVHRSSGKEVEIRIHAIDAPERRQPYADASRHALRERLSREQITVVEHSRDRYDRVIAKLVVDGRDVGLDQIERGFAWHYKQYASQQSRADRERYAAAEKKAKANRIGLWADETAIPPWRYRQQ